MKLTYQDLINAVCNNDKNSAIGIPEFLKSLGMNHEEVYHVANQRALRAILLLHRGQPVPSNLTPIELSEEESLLLIKYTTIFMDGLTAGVVATLSSIKENN